METTTSDHGVQRLRKVQQPQMKETVEDSDGEEVKSSEPEKNIRLASVPLLVLIRNQSS